MFVRASNVPGRREQTNKFEVVAHEGKWYLYNPEGVRISGDMSAEAAEDLRRKMQAFIR